MNGAYYFAPLYRIPPAVRDLGFSRQPERTEPSKWGSVRTSYSSAHIGVDHFGYREHTELRQTCHQRTLLATPPFLGMSLRSSTASMTSDVDFRLEHAPSRQGGSGLDSFLLQLQTHVAIYITHDDSAPRTWSIPIWVNKRLLNGRRYLPPRVSVRRFAARHNIVDPRAPASIVLHHYHLATSSTTSSSASISLQLLQRYPSYCSSSQIQFIIPHIVATLHSVHPVPSAQVPLSLSLA